MTRDAVFGSIAFLAFVAWVGVEFVGLVFWFTKLMHKLGMYEDESIASSSVDTTLAQMDEWPYAATRNASIHRNGG
jgi:hypothetical protein